MGGYQPDKKLATLPPQSGSGVPSIYICTSNCPADGSDHNFSILKREYGSRGQVVSEFCICSKCGLDEISYDMQRLP